MSTWVYNFDKKIKGAQFPLKNLLGGKGANLSEMIRIGLPVPPGFTITTEACNEFYKSKQKYPKSLEKQVKSLNSYASVALKYLLLLWLSQLQFFLLIARYFQMHEITNPVLGNEYRVYQLALYQFDVQILIISI